MHLDFPRMREAGVRAQVFACFVLLERYPGEENERVHGLLAAVESMVKGAGAAFRVARVAGHLRSAFDGGPAAAVIGLDGVVHLPKGLDGVQDYPRIPEALRAAGLSKEKACHGNMLRIFAEGLPN